MSTRTPIPPECNWPSGHEWEGQHIELREDNSIEIEQRCRWCSAYRYGTPIYEIIWAYEERP